VVPNNTNKAMKVQYDKIREQKMLNQFAEERMREIIVSEENYDMTMNT
jgi:hypothetical protein